MNIFGARSLTIAGLILLLSFPAYADDQIMGRVSRVVDGDTFIINEQRVRIWGISAPELKDDYGTEATQMLVAIVKDNDLSCDVKYRDRYKRPVALCTAGGVDIAEKMVTSGMAKDWRKYSGRYYEKYQASAKKDAIGLWKR